MSEFKSFSVGSYQSGSFIIRYYLKDFPYEHVLFSPYHVGNCDINNIYSFSKGGFMTTNRILTYLHECNHFVQDFSLPACLSEDYHYDEMSAFVHAAIEIGCEKFPLINKSNNRFEWWNGMWYNVILHNFLFNESHTSSVNEKYAPLFEDYFFKQIAGDKGLSFHDLLEGYVYYLSIMNLADRSILAGQQVYLNHFKNVFDIFPYSYDEKQHTLNIGNSLTGDSYTYHVARLLFLFKNRGFDIEGAFKYLQNEWPNGYRNDKNSLAFLDCAFFFLLDIALTIPPVVHIRELCRTDKFKIEDFSPVHRFLYELKVIEDNRGFPESIEGEPYYITLFNFLAENLNWLSYEETIRKWIIFFARVDHPNSDTSMGYRRRMFCCKYSKFHKFFFQEPSCQIRQVNIPLICVTKGGMVKIIKKYGNMDIPYEGLFDVYGMFNMPYVPWKEYGEELNNSCDWIKIENDNSESLLREIIYRIISRNIQHAILFRDSFTCSFYNEAFYHAIKDNIDFCTKLPPEIHCKSMDPCKCCKIKDFSQLPECGCAVRDYLKIMKYNTHNKNWI